MTVEMPAFATAYARDQAQLRDRLNAALQRIEQLEADVARLKGPRLQCDVVGCTVPGCTAVHVTHASPATAYPPLPDEGT